MRLRLQIVSTIIIACTLFFGCKKKDKEPEPTSTQTPSQPTTWHAASNVTPSDIYRFCISGNSVFAADGSYVRKSTDEGATWNFSGNGLAAGGGHVYDVKSIGTTLFASSITDGVYVSTDGGNNWSTSNSGLSNLWVVGLATQGSTLLAGTANGIFTSTNNASTWSSSSNGIPSNTSITGLAYDGTLALAIGTPTMSSFSLYRSTNNAANWNVVNNGLPTSATTIYCVAIIGNKCFVGTTSGNFISNDSGTSWSIINSLPNPVVGFDIKNNKIYALGVNSVYVSSDNGITFSVIDNNGLSVTILRSMIITTNYIIVSNSSNNIYRRSLN